MRRLAVSFWVVSLTVEQMISKIIHREFDSPTTRKGNNMEKQIKVWGNGRVIGLIQSLDIPFKLSEHRTGQPICSIHDEKIINISWVYGNGPKFITTGSLCKMLIYKGECSTIEEIPYFVQFEICESDGSSFKTKEFSFNERNIDTLQFNQAISVNEYFIFENLSFSDERVEFEKEYLKQKELSTQRKVFSEEFKSRIEKSKYAKWALDMTCDEFEALLWIIGEIESRFSKYEHHNEINVFLEKIDLHPRAAECLNMLFDFFQGKILEKERVLENIRNAVKK